MSEKQQNRALEQYLALANKIKALCKKLKPDPKSYGYPEYTLDTFTIHIISPEHLAITNSTEQTLFSFSINTSSSNPSCLIQIYLSHYKTILSANYEENNSRLKAQRQDISNPNIDIITFINDELKQSTPQNTESYRSYVATLRQAMSTFKDIYQFANSKTPEEYTQFKETQQALFQNNVQDIHDVLRQYLLKTLGTLKISDLQAQQQPNLTKTPHEHDGTTK